MVSIIIPCRNEEKFIAECLDSIVLQDFPDKEVLVVDGMSEDKTREIVREYSLRHPFIKLLENPNKFTSYGLNIGIKKARSDIIIRMDAHAKYKDDYVSKCVDYLKRSGADNVGGVIRTIPSRDTLTAKGIAVSLGHVFGAGSSLFRTGVEKPTEADTVFGGCYRKEVFEKIGLFNESLERSQDMEFNLRLKKAGGKILLVPDIVSYYYPKATLKEFFSHNVKDGIWAILPLRVTAFSFRHYIPLIFVLTLPLSIWPYILVSGYFSLRIAVSKKNLLLFFVMPLVFATRHIGYGFGSLIGIFKLWKRENKKK